MSYIENDRPGEFFNPVSSTIEINPDCNCPCNNGGNSDYNENLDRWSWLIDKWDKMSFKERLSIFMPYLHYINPRDYYKKEFDNAINNDIADAAYKLCRNIQNIKFDPDGQGIPNIIVVFSPVCVCAIPDAATKNKVLDWGKRFGIIRPDHQHSCN